MKSIVLLFICLLSVFSGMAFELRISGKIRSLKPTEIAVETLRGECLMKASLEGRGEFAMGPVEISTDVYILRIGNFQRAYYLEGGNVTVKGFFDEQDVTKNQLVYTGLELHESLLSWIPSAKMGAQYRRLDPNISKELSPLKCATVAYLADLMEPEQVTPVLELLSKRERKTEIGRWLLHRVDSLSAFGPGALVPDLKFKDMEGKTVSLRDLKGKYLLVDFWASWCGPCRQEMKNIHPLYEELKGENIEFVSISLDDKRDDWERMLREENLPWKMWWNEKGFSREWGAPNDVQRAFGFFQIPFLILVDKDGKIIARHLRGEQVKTEIMKVIK